MDEAIVGETYQFGDKTTSDIVICLNHTDGRPEFHCHKSILIEKSKFFANRIPLVQSENYLEVPCQRSDIENYIKLLKLIYVPKDSLIDKLDSVESAIGVVKASIFLQCEEIIASCVEYLEAMPWDEKEEEEIHKLIPTLGSAAGSLLPRLHPPDLTATKNVLISAIRFATTTSELLLPLMGDLKISAQEQVDFMLAEDEETPLIALDEEVKSAAKAGLAKMLSRLEIELASMCEQQVLQSLSDLDWMFTILSKMELTKEFVSGWADISNNMLKTVQDEKYVSELYAIKFRLLELTAKVLDAIGFGNVVFSSAFRVNFLKTWLPYLRKMKPILDEKCEYRMDVDTCQNVEGAIVSLVLALPAWDQAEIMTEWMGRTEEMKFPDLSEAFEVWCFRTKAAKRRLDSLMIK